MTLPEPRPVRSAFPELVALAAAVRPDWNQAVVTGTLQRADRDGMTLRTLLAKLARVLDDPRATPRDLLPSDKDPTVRRHPDPDVARRGADKARQVLKEHTT